MITFYGWGPMFDCPSPSPYVMKSDMQLQLLDASFNRAFADLESVPKRKAPYLMDGSLLVEDSNFIRAASMTPSAPPAGPSSAWPRDIWQASC